VGWIIVIIAFVALSVSIGFAVRWIEEEYNDFEDYLYARFERQWREGEQGGKDARPDNGAI